jgi:hypothetical protein
MKYLVLILLLVGFTAFGAGETALTVQTVSETEAAIGYESVDVTNANSAANPNGDLFLLLFNEHGADSATVTITAQNTTKTVPGYGVMTKADKVVTLTTLQRKVVGPFRKASWNNSSGLVIITTTGTASGSVDIAAMRVPGE